METDQELFAKGLATYQKVVGQNYMAHREVYGLLHDVLVSEAPKQFVFLDMACGTATWISSGATGHERHPLRRRRHLATVVGSGQGGIEHPCLSDRSPLPEFCRGRQRVGGTGSRRMGRPVCSPSPADRETRLHSARSRDPVARRTFPDLGVDLSRGGGSRRMDGAVSTDAPSVADADRRRIRRFRQPPSSVGLSGDRNDLGGDGAARPDSAALTSF